MEAPFKDLNLESTDKRKRLLDYLIKGASLIISLATIPEVIYWVPNTIVAVSFVLVIFGICFFLNKKTIQILLQTLWY